MGVNNRQRRAAKARAKARERTREATRQRPASSDSWIDPVTFVHGVVDAVTADASVAAGYVRLLSGPASPFPLAVASRVLDQLLRQVTGVVLRSGWLPSDLAELTRRRLTEQHVPALVALIEAEAARHPAERVAPAWTADLRSLGPGVAADGRSAGSLERLLGLAGLMAALPEIPVLIPPPGASTAAYVAASGLDAKLLNRVRALLAKAESTPFEDEAESLSAKAQELITRYSLDRLAVEAEEEREEAVGARRLWIDPPYVLAKASLVQAVATANRCRAVVSEHLGFSTIIGARRDLEAVELLVTSLLVQAHAAMLRCGQQSDWTGTSRTRSFRRAFLIAFAGRIGERLREAAASAAGQSTNTAALLPVLRRQDERVQAACEEMFPGLVHRATSISNGAGWAAGRAAADLARLGPEQALTDEAS